jgi:hypothetical protein
VTAVAEPGVQLAGALRFIRYGFMPNRLRYCGGDENSTLFEYGIEGIVDAGLSPLLNRFTGALPYLQLIARTNGILDPFDDRVVEAYWLGNELLDSVDVRQLWSDLRDRYRGQLTPQTLDLLLGKVPAGARAHHNFHVFDVHSRVGDLENSLETMDQCRVSWGTVKAIVGPVLFVDRQPLLLQEGKLTLGPEIPVRVVRQVDGKGFADRAAIGDVVSIHWNWVCEVISPRQLARLKRETAHHLAIANQTL